MALKYLVSNTTYDFSGPQYTNIGGGSKRLNYIASGKTHQLGLATDKTCSQYSPLVMKVNGTNYYIGRSQSGSYITSDSISSTRINTRTSSGYSAQFYTSTMMVYEIYVEIEEYVPNGGIKRYFDRYTSIDSVVDHCENTHSMLSDGYHDYRRCSYNERQYSRNFYSTSNAYYTTIITNAVNTTVSTAKSASSSSHNFV